jgi:hypothetical protein
MNTEIVVNSYFKEICMKVETLHDIIAASLEENKVPCKGIKYHCRGACGRGQCKYYYEDTRSEECLHSALFLSLRGANREINRNSE